MTHKDRVTEKFIEYIFMHQRSVQNYLHENY